MLGHSNISAARDVRSYKYEKSQGICQIFDSLFYKLHSNHFGASSIPQLYIYASMHKDKINGLKNANLLAVSIV